MDLHTDSESDSESGSESGAIAALAAEAGDGLKVSDVVTLSKSASVAAQDGSLSHGELGVIVVVDEGDDEPYQVRAGSHGGWYQASDLVRRFTISVNMSCLRAMKFTSSTASHWTCSQPRSFGALQR